MKSSNVWGGSETTRWELKKPEPKQQAEEIKPESLQKEEQPSSDYKKELETLSNDDVSVVVEKYKVLRSVIFDYIDGKVNKKDLKSVLDFLGE